MAILCRSNADVDRLREPLTTVLPAECLFKRVGHALCCSVRNVEFGANVFEADAIPPTPLPAEQDGSDPGLSRKT